MIELALAVLMGGRFDRDAATHDREKMVSTP
jgi:hypothetical protein